jgi:hypothetical protein
MGIQKGLAAIKAFNEEQERRKEAGANKVEWLNIPDGETYEIRFLQELDESGAGYVADNGVGFFATEHSNPDDFRKKAVCTAEDGACYGCEQSRLAYAAGDKTRGGGWKAKSRLYINVLARTPKGEEKIAVMSQANGSKSTIAPLVLEYAIDEGTITDRWWKIKRTGQKSDTNYMPRVGQPKDDINPADYSDKLFNLDNCVREVPYAEQEAHYSVTAERPSDSGETESVATSAGKVDSNEEW